MNEVGVFRCSVCGATRERYLGESRAPYRHWSRTIDLPLEHRTGKYHADGEWAECKGTMTTAKEG